MHLSEYKSLIAPCGMNCSTCMAYQRDLKPCPGCKTGHPDKPVHCTRCSVITCSWLAETTSGFCYDCTRFPCQRLKNLDRRYRTNYGISFFKNLEDIQKYGLEKFVEKEQQRWTCKHCGSALCVHRNACLTCSKEYH